jgi:hypothetical protein
LKRSAKQVLWTVLVFSLAGCGGGATIGGTLTGLTAGTNITLQNNGTDNLVLSANGSFVFPSTDSTSSTTTTTTTTNTNTPYDVTVLTQPQGQTCTVTGGSGTANSTVSEVTSVVVQCSSTASLAVNVTGLAAGASVTIIDGTTTSVTATGSGVFAMPGVLVVATPYIITAPSAATNGQICTAMNGSGSIVANFTTTVLVNCI